MTKPWSHLPNARHIDWVIETVKNNPKLWDAAMDASWSAARKEAFVATLNADRVAAWDAARVAVLNAADNASYDAAWEGAWSSIAALIAWDDCKQYLAMTYEELKVYAILSKRPQAVLLLPMKWVQEHEQMDLHRECA